MDKYYTKYIQIIKKYLFPKLRLHELPTHFLVALSYYIIVNILKSATETNLLLVIITFTLDLWNEHTKKLLQHLFPFLLTAIVYDSMRFYINELRLGIHIKDIYLLEKLLFGIAHNGKILSPNEYLNLFTNKFLDIITGFAYLTFTVEYIILTFLVLFSNQKDIAKKMTWAYLLLNILGFITYHLFPAAPPWYILKHGTALILDVAPDPAGAIRFDHFFNVNVFKNMYSMSTNVFGAIPSLHVSYPFLGFLFMLKIKRFRILQGLFSILMCFSAIYLYHHYVIDVILGLSFALTTFTIMMKYPVTLHRVVPKD